MAVRTSHFSHIGQRKENQDRCAVFSSADGNSCLLLVADGLGGHSGGAVAADTVVDTAKRCWERGSTDETAEALLRRLAFECHKAVRQVGRRKGLDPQSTLAALVLENGRAVSAHVGDSRIIQFSRAGFVERTLDHSAAQLLVLEGRITEDEMATHPDQNIVFSQIGGNQLPDPRITVWDLAKGNCFILCSDGFWEIFPTEEMHRLFAARDPAVEAQRQTEAKLEHMMEHDNVTAIFAERENGGRPMSLFSAWAQRLTGSKRLVLASFMLAATVAMPFGTDCSFSALAQESENLPDKPADSAREGREADWTEEDNDAVSDDNPEADAEPASEAPDADPASQGKPVPLDQVSIDADLPIGPGETAMDVAEAEMRRQGRIGADDSLVLKGDPGEVGDSVFTRVGQTHQDIPVFGAQVVIRAIGNRIVTVSGDLAADIELPANLPEHDYPTTLDLASELLDKEITPTPWDEGTKVIFALADGYRLAWLGEVTIGNAALEQAIFDAADGAALFRVPAMLDTEMGRSTVNQEKK